jgi:tetratricopeptide (TPR) repeat protein
MPNSRLETLLLLAVTLVATAVAHGPGLRGAFVFDDIREIRDNASLDVLWPPWVAMLEGGSLPHRPLPYYTFALNRALHGTDVRGYHLVNLAIHVANGLLIWWLVATSLTTWCGWIDSRRASLVGWATATLWLVHPLGTQAVTYIYQRMELMAALAILCTLAGFIQAIRPNRTAGESAAWLTASVVACGLGMGCKETAAAAPLLVPLFDALVAGTPPALMLRRRAGYFLASAACWGILAAVIINQRERYPELNTGRVLWWEYALNQPRVILHYLRLAVWPSGLCFDYGWPVERSPAALLPAILAVATLLTVAVAAIRWNRPLAFLGLAFFLLLAPTSSLLPVTDLCVEHRMYLPLACLVAVAVLGLDRLLRLVGLGRVAAAGAIGLGIAASAAASHDRTGDYGTRLGLWSAAVRAAPENPRAVAAVAEALYRAGRLEEAVVAYERSIAMEPAAAVPHTGRAACLLRLGRHREAAEAARTAISLAPDHPAAHSILGESLLRLGDPAAALAACRDALALDPTNPATIRTRDEALGRLQ